MAKVPTRLRDRRMRGSYVYRGDRERRWQRIRGTLSACALLGGGMALAQFDATRTAGAAPPLPVGLVDDRALRDTMWNVQGKLDLAAAELHYLRTIVGFSTRFAVAAGLAREIFEAASAEGIDPELAFRLVRVESGFNERATSSAGAIGLTQLMYTTARYFQDSLRREDLFSPRTNLRIGFRYLRSLIDEQNGDLRLALLAYNRGPQVVARALSNGRDPANGYDTAVLRGYTGRGILP